jgi:hypothetical protein
MKPDMTSAEFREQRKPHKYGARSCIIDGIRFDSRREGNRYSELRLLELAQVITGLRCQVWFRLEVNGMLICKYRADFCYIEGGQEITEDSKGFRTDAYRIKSKLMEAVHGIKIRET